MKKAGRSKSVLALVLAAAVLVGAGSSAWITTIVNGKAPAQTLDELGEILDYPGGIENYREYVQKYDSTVRPDDKIVIEAAEFTRTEGMTPEVLNDYEGNSGKSLYTEEAGLVEYEFTVEEEGFYELGLEYYPVEGNSAAIQRSVFLDRELPYSQLSLVEFPRVWVNERDVWESDNQGNDLKPTQIEAPQWLNANAHDSEGYVTEALSLWLTKGEHTLTLVSRREPMVLRRITLSNEAQAGTYEEVRSKDSTDWKDSEGQLITIQAEDADRKSSQMLYPTQDQSSPAVYPYSAKSLKNNTIGGSSWRMAGQWLEWDFEVPQSGYYYITLHAKQNFVKGVYVSRKISVDGQVPFEEMSDYPFLYESSWRMETLSDDVGQAYRFYLEEGQHTLRMEAVLGEFSEVIGEVQEILRELNSEYRKIIRITGVAPDEFRDYQIEKSLPELASELAEIRDHLDEVILKLQSKAGAGSDKETVLITMRDQLDYVSEDIERITKVVGSFKTNISALGTWITQVVEQPLQLDAIYVSSPDKELPKQNDSFGAKLLHEIKKLYWSFRVDYNAIGNVSDGKENRSITVWVGTGRDQANVIKSLIDERFTVNNGIAVDVMLVDMNTLLQATLSGQGPDVAIQVANNTMGGATAAASGTTGNSNDLPMNYGLRNAVVDLSTVCTAEELEEIKGRFRDSALTPFTYEGSLYALPETQTFPMMFYRKDILKELDLEVPQTWDDMKVAMSVMSENQMELGMLPQELIWTSILYQNGGELYTPDATASALDSDNAVNAFKEYCDFYTDYKLARDTSVEQRFRTGESPLIIADYTTYNNLQVSAPDIKGLWGFAPIPGVKRADGSVDNTAASTGLACMMMSKAEDKEAAWEFMKWWTSADIQTAYGREMEGLMGAAARYPSANVEAFKALPWPSDDFEALDAQFGSVRGIPQVPGGYYSWRNVNNAFYRVTVSQKEKKMPAREALSEYVRYINDEITYKRNEFGLPVAE